MRAMCDLISERGRARDGGGGGDGGKETLGSAGPG